jgi:hypothetical protein
LGTLDDFKSLVRKAREAQMEIALDIAFQCAPDHPYVKEHPNWFKHRPDGSVQYAENPPKKYQDIYPFDFESDDWRGLWVELKSCSSTGLRRACGVSRRQSPHQILRLLGMGDREIKRDWPEVIFLAEAFTRPKVMHRLAKLGFTQSYTYFTWRTAKQELVDYFTELSSGPERVLSPQCVAEHARHPARIPAIRSACRVCGKIGAGGHLGGELRHLRADLRAHAEHAARARQRGISGLREISAATWTSIKPTACGP